MTKEQIEKMANECSKAYSDEDIYDAFVTGKKIGVNEGFTIGALWRINSVWHDASEMPEDGRLLLCITPAMPMVAGPNNEGWSDTVEVMGVTRWAYVDDLLPTEE